MIILQTFTTVPAVTAAADSTPLAAGQYDLFKDDSYYRYTKENPLLINGDTIPVDPLIYKNASGVSVVWDDDKNKNVLNTNAESMVEWQVNVPRAGSYAIRLDYKPLKGTGIAISRTVLIDGELPFAQSYDISFSRVYKDSGPITATKNGNDYRPAQDEIFSWDSTYLHDSMGYYGSKFYFYLSAGSHNIVFESLKEPMAIAGIELESTENALPDYETALAGYKKDGAKVISGAIQNGITIYQAECPYAKSDPSIIALNDNSSPATVPYDYQKLKLNVMGSTRWQEPGQWIAYQIVVPESGLYNLGFRFKQNYLRDVKVARELSIDGQIPFKEAANLTFAFNTDYQVQLAGGKEPYLFYFDKGKHIIKFQVTLGDLNEHLVRLSDSLSQLSAVNWQLLTLLGNYPDIYKSYNIAVQMPDAVDTLRVQAKNLNDIAAQWSSMTGNVDSNVAKLQQIAFKLDRMANDPDLIPSMYTSFRDDISTLGDLINTASKQPLQFDSIFVSEQDSALPKATTSFFISIKYKLLRFFASFFNDYNILSPTGETVSKEGITVWVGSGVTGGRDQALALNQLITQTFSAEKNIPVNVQIVPADIIVTATMASIGPDVALQLGGGQPVNFAMRHAVENLKSYDGYNEVMNRFLPATYRGFEFEGGIYALPETMSFPMIFYRTDIMKMLGIDINSIKTWDDIIHFLPLLQGLNMNFALPASFSQYVMFLYQNKGKIYNSTYTQTELDQKVALDLFDYHMKFYMKYGAPYIYSFEMRFRTGEIPIGIADFTTYNTLQLSAPEIKGKWEMRPVPGTIQPDGSISNVAPASSSGCVMLSASKHKQEAWEFMKWWTSADIQYQFGKELESVLGVASRYNTANIEAMENLPWNIKDMSNLRLQMNSLEGIPEVPGSYMVVRYVDFAVKSTYNNNTEARKNLLSYIKSINDEITFKRREFGLSK